MPRLWINYEETVMAALTCDKCGNIRLDDLAHGDSCYIARLVPNVTMPSFG